MSRTLADALAAHDEAPAVLASGGRVWTYADIRHIAAAVGPGEVVALQIRDPASLAVAVAAVASTGVAVPLPEDLPPEQSSAMAERASAGRLVFDLADLAVSGSVPTPPRQLDDVAVVLATSGSTDRPKLVPNTHRNLWISAAAVAEAHSLGPADRCLVLGPMWHTLGVRALTDALHAGAAVILPDDVTAASIAYHLEAHAPTCVIAPPPALQTLALALAELSPAGLAEVIRSLRYVRSAAAAVPPRVAERLAQLVPTPLLRAYGMSEVAKIACTPLGQVGTPEGSVGRPLAVDLRIQRSDDTEASEGEVGEVVVRGDAVAPGYLDDPERTATVFRGGWFHTGDLGRLDGDGYLYLHGRVDDVANRGGEKVDLAALEQVLERHPSVEAALAAAVPHPSLGQDVVVAYVPAADSPPTPAPALREFLGATFSAGQLPSRFEAVTALPLAASGKPSRKALAASVEANQPGDDVPADATQRRLAELWTELLVLETPVRPDDDFFALGGDSLLLLELCTAIAATFDVRAMPAELIGHASLREMSLFLRASRSRAGARATLVSLRSGADGRVPVFMVPPRGGSLASLHGLLRKLAPDRPLFGFEALGLYPGEKPLRSVRRIAEMSVEELVGELGEGSFVLVGASFGGMVAQEMACQLHERGRPPELLVIFDCPAPDVARSLRGTGDEGHTRLQRLAIFARLTARASTRLVKGALNRLDLRRDPPPTIQERVERCRYAHLIAARLHRARRTPVPTALFTSDEKRARAGGDPQLGWGPYVSRVVATIEFEGTHLPMLSANAALTAPALDRLFEECDRAVAEGRALTSTLET